MQVSIGVCLYLVRMGGSLPHTDREGLGGDQMPDKGDNPLVWDTWVYWLGYWASLCAEMVQLVARGLGITWKLHTAYRPPSSGKLECMDRTLKLWLGKLCQETHLHWDQLLFTALLRMRLSPMKQTGLLPFEVIYGCPSTLTKGIQGDLKEIGDLTLRQQMQALKNQ
jgi:hypothetical protein